jgi:hypothetical protein
MPITLNDADTGIVFSNCPVPVYEITTSFHDALDVPDPAHVTPSYRPGRLAIACREPPPLAECSINPRSTEDMNDSCAELPFGETEPHVEIPSIGNWLVRLSPWNVCVPPP